MPKHLPPSSGPIRYPSVKVTITVQGETSNNFYILGRTRDALQRAGVTEAECDAYIAQARKGDYDNLIAVTRRWVTLTVN